MVNKILENKFEEVKNEKIALIDFSATWCGPCKRLAPVLEEVSEEINDVKFYNIDIDECPTLAKSFNVYSIPTLLILKDGKAVDTMIGFQPKVNILTFIKDNI